MKIHTSFETLEKIKNPVVTIGTFDGVHLGHRSIIRRLREIADRIGGETVLLSFYPHPRIILYPEDHGVALLNSPEEKAQLLREAGIDHFILYPFSTEFSRLTPFEYVRDLLVTGIHAHTVVVGYDHRFGRNREGDHNTLLELSEIFGFAVEEIQAEVIDNNNVSSTKIRQALLHGNVQEANKFLGYNYKLCGTVVKGDQIGRTIGYPTANIQPNYPFKLIPAKGIYAVRVIANNQVHRGVMSIGVRPTVTDNPVQTIEVFILDFTDDVYGKTICVEFIDFIRGEEKFGSIDELKTAIGRDIEAAMHIF